MDNGSLIDVLYNDALVNKVLGTVPNRLIRGVSYCTNQELVRFSHEKWSEISDCSKIAILYRCILPCSVQLGFDSG